MQSLRYRFIEQKPSSSNKMKQKSVQKKNTESTGGNNEKTTGTLKTEGK